MSRFLRIFAPGATLGSNAPLWAALLPAAVFEAVGLRLGLTAVDPDYWWHLATGRWMLDHGRIPTADPFSFTHIGQNWYAHEWLGELVIGLTNRVAGYAGCVVLTALLVTLALWLTGRTVQAFGVSRRETFIFVAAGAFFLIKYLAVRPQVWSWVTFALLLHELIAFDRGRRRRLWYVPLIFIFWINLHLSALIGIACLGLYTTLCGLRWLRARSGSAGILAAAFRHTALVSLLSVLALNVNPRGPGLLWFARLYLNQNVVYYRYISEYQHLAFAGYNRLLYLVALPLLALTVYAMWHRRLLWPGLLALLFAVAAQRAIRYVPLFIFVAVPVAGWLAGGLIAKARVRPSLPVARPFALVLAGTMVAVLLVLGPALPGTEFRRTPTGGSGNFPVDATVWLKANRPQARLFNDYNWGGYLVNAFYADQRVYIDGRTEMYGERYFDAFVQTIAARTGWQETLAQSGAGAVLVNPTEPIATALNGDPRWQRVYADSVAAVYETVGAASR